MVLMSAVLYALLLLVVYGLAGGVKSHPVEIILFILVMVGYNFLLNQIPDNLHMLVYMVLYVPIILSSIRYLRNKKAIKPYYNLVALLFLHLLFAYLWITLLTGTFLGLV
ncbi:Uncharacterised protein [Streptococcus dysgalactiae subsp. dysgalactiae]|uniref:hypothetical protein n=1 Tax=Streptococcus dysgalactiae TaxID=1334 RepID=UPI000F6D957A|nr:hypothetical protein [Streptococcus dysgalactiae]VDZ41209.1 Uncharacterised protein [Streptococcus dysgalactiae subsp. dysgalactiae]